MNAASASRSSAVIARVGGVVGDWTEAGADLTMAGVTILRFGADGSVVDQRDYWNQSDLRAAVQRLVIAVPAGGQPSTTVTIS